jgi:hypothetical protein
MVLLGLRSPCLQSCIAGIGECGQEVFVAEDDRREGRQNCFWPLVRDSSDIAPYFSVVAGEGERDDGNTVIEGFLFLVWFTPPRGVQKSFAQDRRAWRDWQGI